MKKKSVEQEFQSGQTEISGVQFEVVGTNSLAPPHDVKSDSKSMADRLSTMRWVDILIRIGLRLVVAVFFGGLLVYQNYFVFSLIQQTLEKGVLKELQPILAVIVTATLIETYKIAQIIVKWLFQDIKYD